MTADPSAFFRVFAARPDTGEAAHTRFHARCFPPGCGYDTDTSRDSLVSALSAAVGGSTAPAADREHVAAVLADDWRTARTLAVMASSAVAGGSNR